ncbi:MAG: MFS transporter, partial [Dehalococcoidia bacterium]
AILVLVGGVVADRVERRRILVRTYSVAAVVSLAYVFLAGLDVALVWPVFILAAVIGSVDAFAQPARLSTPPQILPQVQLQNGLILGTVAFMSAFQFAGPAIGGILAAGPGLTAAFSAEVAFLVIAVFLATRLRVPPMQPTGKTIRGDLVDGLRYARSSPQILGILLLNLAPGIFLIGPMRVTVVLFVEDVLKTSDAFVGLLTGAFGIGVLVGSILMTLRPLPRRGLLLCGAPLIGGPTFVLYGLSEITAVSMGIQVFWGLSAALFINLGTPLLQESTSRPMLGRVMSMSNLMFSVGIPLGLLQSGIVASIWGPQTCVIVSGIAFTFVGVLALAFLRPIRSLE